MKFKDIIKDETNKFLLNKIEWLNNDNTISENTKITYYRLFNQIKDIEESKGKDINKFTGDEVEEVVKSYITNSEQTKRSLYSAISSYLNWCVDNDIISYNVCDTIINPKELYQVNETIVREQYMNLDEFYRWLDNDLSADDNMLLCLVLCRYGVAVKQIPFIRWKDLDVENKVLYVETDNRILELIVDDMFISRVDKAKRCDETYSGKEYKDIGYMIKSLRAKPLSASGVYSLILKISEESNINRIDVNFLNKSRQLDLIFEIVKKNGKIFTEEVGEIMEKLGVSNSPTQITVLSRLLSNFNVEIMSRRTGKEVLVVNLDGEVFGEYESVSACAKDLSARVGNISRSTILRHIRMDTDFYGLKFVKEE